MRCALWLCAGLCMQAADVRAQVEARGPALNWVRLDGAETCIAPVELAERIERRLGRRVFVRAPDAIIVVEGQVAPAQPSGFAAVVRVSNAAGEIYGARDLALPDTDCRHLDEVLALVIAVTIRGRGGGAGIALPPDVSAVLDALFSGEPTTLDPSELPPPGPEPNVPAATPAGSVPAALSSTPRSPASRNWKLFAGVGAWAASGLQPDGTLGLSAHVGLGFASIGSAVLSGALGLPRQIAAPDPDSAQDGALTLQPRHAALALCAPDLKLGQSELALCGSIAIAAIHATPEGFAIEKSVTETWVELGPEASLRVPIAGLLFLRFALRMPVRASRPGFTYRRLDATSVEAFRVDAVGVEGEAALGIGG